MIEIHNVTATISKIEPKKRRPIDSETKSKLIHSVVQDHLPIYQAAIIHKVKYSSAKHILRNYLSDTANFFSMQRKRKRKIVCNNSFILVDFNSGNISLQLQKSQALPCQTDGIAAITQRILNQMAYSIQKEVSNIQQKTIDVTNKLNLGSNIKINEKIENKINLLYSKLKRQHEMMQNLILLQ